jgi:hypothetical protein
VAAAPRCCRGLRRSREGQRNLRDAAPLGERAGGAGRKRANLIGGQCTIAHKHNGAQRGQLLRQLDTGRPLARQYGAFGSRTTSASVGLTV